MCSCSLTPGSSGDIMLEVYTRQTCIMFRAKQLYNCKFYIIMMELDDHGDV